MRNCGLSQVSPTAFTGLENYLELLDLSENNITSLHQEIFNRFQLLRTLSLSDNPLKGLTPMEMFNSFQFSLNKLDLSGRQNAPVIVQDLRRYL